MEMKTKILIAMHKPYPHPKSDLYLPIAVGQALHPNRNLLIQPDNTGDNISRFNNSYCELTALYWGWKNLDVDALGLVHYRRYLSTNHAKDLKRVLNQEQVDAMLKDHDIILPKKRQYFIETNESHYRHAHENLPLQVMIDTIYHHYPKYVPALKVVLSQRTSAHMFNIFVMKKQPLDEYCTWLFDILHQVDQQIDASEYSDYEKRYDGFLSELMLDVWLLTHPEYSTVETDYVFMEHQNWLKKGGRFLRRKLVGHPGKDGR